MRPAGRCSRSWAPAWALADRDALYIALAASLDAILVTIDIRLRRDAAGLVEIAAPGE